MPSEAYRLFAHFWWLIFPVFWMILGMTNLWLRHGRANRTIDIIKSYVDQGKDPPPELLAALRRPDYGRRGGRGWMPVFVFGALAIAFGAMAALRHFTNFDHFSPFIFIVILMTGLCLGSVVSALSRNRDRDRDPPR